MKAAYADGVVRGSWQREWMINQFNNTDVNSLANVNDTTIGALAYVYLKTNNQRLLNVLNEWNCVNIDNHAVFAL